MNVTHARRPASTAGELGYQQQPAAEIAKVRAVIDAAIANDIYVLTTGNDHHAEDHVEMLSPSFGCMASGLYETGPHVIYDL